MRSADREHYGLAVCCAKRFQGRGVAMEDLIAEAEAALLYAASRFDESRGVRFSTYAIPVALGALKALCRSQSRMHVPRGEMRILALADRAREACVLASGREPDVEALAGAVGVEPGRLLEMLLARERMQLASSALDAAGAREESFEDRFLLREAVRSLPAPFAQVVWLRFGAGLTQQEIARRLGAGQPQVSRWEKKGVALLREAFEP